MSNLSNSFTDDELRGMITGDNPQSNAYRELLALREAGKEPVAWIVHARGGDQITQDGDYVANAEGMGRIHSTQLYAAPQLPIGLHPAPALESTDKTGEPPASSAEDWVMDIDENTAAEMQMALVRICRQERNSHGVWTQMKNLFPEFELDEIKSAVRPAIARMMEAL